MSEPELPGPPLDEDAVWDLVRSVAPGTSPPFRVAHPNDAETWLEVDAGSHWRTSGSTSESTRDIIELYLPLQLRRELVIGQLGQSLDGRIATESGHSHFVTGPADIRRLHRLRALVDAVIVGAETVRMDDPRLTVREVAGRDPVRVILDPSRRIGAGSRLFAGSSGPAVVVCRADAAGPAAPGSAPTGDGVAGIAAGAEGTPTAEATPTAGAGADAASVDVITLPLAGPEGFDPRAVLRALRERGLHRVLVEGGGITVSRFLAAGVLNRLHVTVAPLLIGSGRAALSLPPIETLGEALRPPCRHFRLGDDILFDLDLDAL